MLSLVIPSKKPEPRFSFRDRLWFRNEEKRFDVIIYIMRNL